MAQSGIESLADGIASILLSYAAHGLATTAIDGMGEITLRDGLVVAAAAAGARRRQAWILEREVVPPGWTDAAVDLVVSRCGNQGNITAVGSIELKWWRRTDKGNAANRRRDLVKDFIRAASHYQSLEEFSFVALLSTAGSWSSTASTNASDKDAMAKLATLGSQKWNVERLIHCSSVKGAVRALNQKVPVPNIFHTELLSNQSINKAAHVTVFAKVWAVKKPQKTRILGPDEIDELVQ